MRDFRISFLSLSRIMKSKSSVQPRSVGIHDGTFHADEVTACALLILYDLVDRDKIVRTRDPELLARCEYVCDVGGEYIPGEKLFDHHQSDYVGNLSSAGMILRYLKEEGRIDPRIYGHLRGLLVDGIDAHDNGKAPIIEGTASFSQVVSNFTPVEHSVDSGDENRCFYEALEFVIGHLSRMLRRFAYVECCQSKVESVMKMSSTVMIFDESLPWLEPFFALGGVNHPAVFVIMPTGQHWKLRGVPPSFEERMSVRLPLPEKWAGLLENDLKRVSGIKGAIFCHKGRFISVWQSKEDALKALDLALAEEQKTV